MPQTSPSPDLTERQQRCGAADTKFVRNGQQTAELRSDEAVTVVFLTG